MTHRNAWSLLPVISRTLTAGQWAGLVIAAASGLAAQPGCGGDEDAVVLNALVDGRRPPDLRGGADVAGGDSAGGPCRTAADCVGVALGPCRVPVCLPDGACGGAVADDGEACDDGEVCTGEDRCVSGACEGGAPADAVPCDDGDPCTTSDACRAGACEGAGVLACDDGNACTAEECVPGVGCVASERSCPDPPGDPCLRGACDPVTGACGVAPRAEGEACDDGLGCTVGSVCQGGACVGVVGSECDDDNACTIDFCTAAGCGHSSAVGGCDDGDPCTVGDGCAFGACVGEPLACDDGDPCTADACAEGECRFEPIAGCVPPTGDCAEAPLGAACDDGDPASVADLCAGGECRGFALRRVEAGAGQRYTRVSRTEGRWIVASALVGAADGAAGELVEVGADGVPVAAAGTRNEAEFVGLHDAFAVDAASGLWVYGAGAWSATTPMATALVTSGPGLPRAVWSYRDPSGDVRVWLVGESLVGGPWVRRCLRAAATPGAATCNAQSVIGGEEAVLRAVVGTTACSATSCTASLAAAADLFESTGADGVGRYFNDVYSHNGTAGAAWQVAAFDPGQSRMTSEDIAGVAPGRFLVVGGYGYLRTNGPSGVWSSTPTVVDGQDQHHFGGVAAGSGVVAVVGWRALPGILGTRQLVLLVAASGADLTDPGVWHRHVLGTESGEGVGLADVAIDGARWLIVGAGRSGAEGPLQGLALSR